MIYSYMNNKTSINAVIIDDDINYARLLKNLLINKGITSDISTLIHEGLAMIQLRHYDLIILDFCIPDEDSNQFLKTIRESKQGNLPIVIISAFDILSNKISALQNGADDYIHKLSPKEEIGLRILNAFKRAHRVIANQIKVGTLIINLLQKNIQINHEIIKLTSTEYILLELLARFKNHTLSKEFILEKLYRTSNKIAGCKIIDVLICKIRKQLKQYSQEEYIQTIWGVGYAINNQL